MAPFTRIQLDTLGSVACGSLRHLYVIGEAGTDAPVKVGRARHALWRLQDLQAGNHRQLELRACWLVERLRAHFVETQLRHHLGESLVRGEWFDVSADTVAAHIERIRVAND